MIVLRRSLCILFVSFFVFCCSKRKSFEDKDSSLDTINYYLKLGNNSKLPPSIRLKYNLKGYKYIVNGQNDSIHRKKLFEISDNFFFSGYVRGFYISSKTLLQNSIKSNDSIMQGFAHQQLGRYYDDKLQSDSSYYHFLKAKKIFINLDSKYKIYDLNFDIANLQYHIGDFAGSEKTLFTLLKMLSKQDKVDNFKYLSNNLLGIIYCELYQFKQSIEYHKKALKIAEQTSVSTYFNAKEVTFTNIGNVYQYSGQYSKSIYFYKKALSQNALSKQLNSYAIILDNIAYSEFKCRKYNNVPALFYKSLKIRDSLQLINGIIGTKLHLSEYYAFKKDLNKASRFAVEAKDLSLKNKLCYEYLASLKQLINIKDKNAIYYSQQYIKINDSLQLAERRNRNKFARIAFETDEITSEKENAIKQKWIILSVAVGIILFGILLFIIKAQRAKQKELLFVQRQQIADESIYQLIHDRQIKIDEGRQQEKKRIAQELHDGVMNRLTSTRLNLFVLNKKKDDETIEKCLEFINDIQNIEKEIRQVAHDLDNDIFSGNNSFNTILESLFTEFKTISSSNLFTEIDSSINWEVIESIIKMNLYRIIQEVLQNCNKYAEAKNVYLNISPQNNGLILVINDDGVGFEVKKIKNGIGLKNIRDRVKILTGKIDISSRKGKGTTIIVNLPIKPTNQNLRQNGKKN